MKNELNLVKEFLVMEYDNMWEVMMSDMYKGKVVKKLDTMSVEEVLNKVHERMDAVNLAKRIANGVLVSVFGTHDVLVDLKVEVIEEVKDMLNNIALECVELLDTRKSA